MNKRPLITLIFGGLAVVLLIAALVVYQDRKDSHVDATEASISATTYDVGVEYSGVLSSQNVQKGQKVSKGQLLATIKSGTLMERLREAKLQPQDLPYPINDKSEIELKAANDGIVKSVNFAGGSFVPANQAIYTIIDVNQYYVTSKFTLGTEQLEDLTTQKNVELKLQSGMSLPTRIRDMVIKPAEGGKQEITVESVPASQLNQESFKLGEPVQTSLILRDQDYWTHITNWTSAQWAALRKLVQQ